MVGANSIHTTMYRQSKIPILQGSNKYSWNTHEILLKINPTWSYCKSDFGRVECMIGSSVTYNAWQRYTRVVMCVLDVGLWQHYTRVVSAKVMHPDGNLERRNWRTQRSMNLVTLVFPRLAYCASLPLPSSSSLPIRSTGNCRLKCPTRLPFPRWHGTTFGTITSLPDTTNWST